MHFRLNMKHIRWQNIPNHNTYYVQLSMRDFCSHFVQLVQLHNQSIWEMVESIFMLHTNWNDIVAPAYTQTYTHNLCHSDWKLFNYFYEYSIRKNLYLQSGMALHAFWFGECVVGVICANVQFSNQILSSFSQTCASQNFDICYCINQLLIVC